MLFNEATRDMLVPNSRMNTKAKCRSIEEDKKNNLSRYLDIDYENRKIKLYITFNKVQI